MKRSEWWCGALFLISVIVGVVLRFYQLDEMFLRYDEGRLWSEAHQIVVSGQGQYNYLMHGITGYFLTAIPLFWSDSVWSIRLVTALFGSASLLLIWPLRRYLGVIGTLVAASFIAVSPALAYYARFAMYYNELMFFLLLNFVLLVKFFETKKTVWLYLFAVITAIMLSIHEFTLVFLALLALLLLIMYSQLRWRAVMVEFWRSINRRVWFYSVVIFIWVFVGVFSFFGKNFDNLVSFFTDGLILQWRQSHGTLVNKSFFYYFWYFIGLERWAFLGMLGLLFVPKKNLFIWALSVWSVILALAISLIPYKLPWIFILVLPFWYLALGAAAHEWLAKLTDNFRRHRIKTTLVVLLMLSSSLFLTIKWNFWYPNSSYNLLNYYGPSKDSPKLMVDLSSYLNSRHKIAVAFEDRMFYTSYFSVLYPKVVGARDWASGRYGYWPLPYYLRQEQTSYLVNEQSDRFIESYPNYDIYITNAAQVKKRGYYLLGEYNWREGYPVYVYIANNALITH